MLADGAFVGCVADAVAAGLDNADLLGDLSAEDLPAATEVSLPGLPSAAAQAASVGSYPQSPTDGTNLAAQSAAAPSPLPAATASTSASVSDAGNASAAPALTAQNGPASWFGKLVSGAQQAASRAQADAAASRPQSGNLAGDIQHGDEANAANGMPTSGRRGQSYPRPGGFQRRGSFRGRFVPSLRLMVPDVCQSKDAKQNIWCHHSRC